MGNTSRRAVVVYGSAHYILITLIGDAGDQGAGDADARFFSSHEQCLNRAHEVLARAFALSRSN